ncbi:MAG: lipoyl synthase [Thermodesulfobacteriota bacterium]|nr:lipoyl synthase [Thermodesulfobacteriota bacterium]
MKSKQNISIRKPPWLRRRLPTGPEYEQVRSLIKKNCLHTVCQEAKCPNQFECFSRHTAAFLILGPGCSRNCRFCSVSTGPSGPPDPEEPRRVAEAAAALNLKYVVVTSVTRDDLPDGGAGFFAKTITAIRKRTPDALVEVLIPDLKGDQDALKTVINARPDVLNHNIETVARLYHRVRPEAEYQRSLDVLKQSHDFDPSIPLKSGLMLGLGETSAEIQRTIQDLYNSRCRILTLGQYLQPGQEQLKVERFAPPKEFDDWFRTALKTGFQGVASGPFVRSSYHAHDLYKNIQSQKRHAGLDPASRTY